ncbi:MAG: sulfite exporter TauE/SafE family protein [Chloroflexi bacterium]|nr:sulfite exporter TauE/SafE family protein [Chloroflexota bacterium]
MPDLPVMAIDLSPLNASLGEYIFLGVFSFVFGVVAGMVGVALGVIRLPVMLALGFNPVVSAGTNLGVSILGGATASWPHWRGGRIVPRVVLVIGLPAIVGSFLGGLFAEDVKSWMLLSVIAAILAISAAATFRQWWNTVSQPLRPIRHRPPAVITDPTGVSNIKPKRVAVDSGLGVVIGLIGGAAGLVLGTLRLPVLLNVLRMDPRYAAGTNNAIGVLVGTFGLVGHVLNFNFDIIVFIVMGSTGMVGSYIGATQTGKVSSTLMRLIVAIMLTAVTPIVIIRAILEFPN